jgi:hypothetical protein
MNRIKHFLIHAGLAAKHLERKKTVRRDLDAQLNKVRTLSVNQNVDSSEVHKEVDRLQDKINELIGLETQILSNQGRYDKEIKTLQKKVTKEKKKAKKATKSALDILKDHLKKLEKEHARLAKQGHDKPRLKRLEKRISDINKRIKAKKKS